MAGNVFGTIFRLITFGESHGPATGGIVEGCPAGLPIDIDFLQEELNRRRPGWGPGSTDRREEDHLEILSGISNGISLGTPIGFVIRNRDMRSEDYLAVDDLFRPSHADYSTLQKYGIRDARGGGRSSARETAARVAGGAIASLLLAQYNIRITAFTQQVGPYKLDEPIGNVDTLSVRDHPLYCPDRELGEKMIRYLEQIKKERDTTGGAVGCRITGVPSGLGEPVFDKLHADLGKAILSIGACKGYEIGSGFFSAEMKGSEHNDVFTSKEGRVVTSSNHSGGIQGGISNGMDIWFRAAFKPVPSIKRPQQTVDESGMERTIELEGRHDICVIPRVIPVVEAMTALTFADHLLRNRSARI